MTRENSLKKILITGTDSGIGEATVKYLVDKGYYIYAGVLDEKNYKKWDGTENICPVILDITNKDHIQSVKNKLNNEGSVLYAIINNAGVTCWGPILEIKDEEIEEPFRVNLFGTRLITKAFIPLLSKGDAKIINIGSNSAQAFIPFMGPYPLSKVALKGFTHAIRRELLVNNMGNIKVALIEPGSIVTPMWDKAKKNIHFPTNKGNVYSPENNKKSYDLGIFLTDDDMENSPQPIVVSKLIFKILQSKNPKTRYYIGRHRYTMNFFSHLPDKLLDWMIKLSIKSMQKKL